MREVGDLVIVSVLLSVFEVDCCGDFVFDDVFDVFNIMVDNGCILVVL